MSDRRWERVRQVLEDALERDPEQRATFLDQVCADEPEVRREVESLIAREDQIDDDLAEPAVAFAASPLPGPRRLPEQIGEYRVIRQIAEGGMGLVYEAEQQHPQRRVALKVVRGGRFVDEQSLRMFKREVDTLARLRHPNIAAIYESGRTDEGEHFFAMELLRGATLDAYAESRPVVLSAEEQELRLRLVKTMADAVHHAHQRGVIHRDLKPTNVMVSDGAHAGETSDSGAPLPEVKILDFGLARITEADVAVTRTTDVGVIKGTLAYMSPEQARGHSDEIDVRTDVYSLGVILYELLTGQRPYDVKDVSLAAALRMICEQPPAPMRQSWSGVGKPDPDLETIVFKALEKDADQRYASSAALAEDIERYLTLQPILARPTSATYQLRKFARRNRAAVAAAAVALAALVIGATVAGVAAVRATRAEKQAVAALAAAERDARTATEVTDFLVRAFEVNDPGESRGNTITVREVLDTASAGIQTELAGQPLVQARMMHTMGKVYTGLGLFEPAALLAESASTIRERELGGDDLETADALTELGIIYWNQERRDEAEVILRRAIAIYEAELGPDHLSAARAMLYLGNTSESEEAEDLKRRTVAIRERELAPDDPELAMALNDLGVLLMSQSRYEESKQLFERALAIFETSDDYRTRYALINLAWWNYWQGNMNDAAALGERAVASAEENFGPDHVFVAYDLHSMGTFYRVTARNDLARQALERSLAIREAVAELETEAAANTMGVLASIHDVEGRYEEAERWLRRALDISKRVGAPDSNVTDWLRNVLGIVLMNQHEYDEAQAVLEQLVADREARYGPDNTQVAMALSNLGVVYNKLEDYAASVTVGRRAVAIAAAQLKPTHPYLASYRNALAIGLAGQGNFAEAESLFIQARTAHEAESGPDHPNVVQPLHGLANVYRDQGRTADAEPLYARALTIRKKALGADHPDLIELKADYAELLRQTGRFGEAADLEQ